MMVLCVHTSHSLTVEQRNPSIVSCILCSCFLPSDICTDIIVRYLLVQIKIAATQLALSSHRAPRRERGHESVLPPRQAAQNNV